MGDSHDLILGSQNKTFRNLQVMHRPVGLWSAEAGSKTGFSPIFFLSIDLKEK
jgi:hypothetical protein